MIRRVRVQRGTLELSDEGNGEATVLLLHGFTGSKESWLGLRRALVPPCGNPRRVIALDLPGHGGTEIGADPADFSMGRVTEMMEELLDRLDIKSCSLVGYSMGGRLALHFTLDRPGRVERLALESASPGIADPAERAERVATDEALAALLESAGIEAFVERWEALPLFWSLADLPESAKAELRRQRLACSPQGLAVSLRGMGAGVQPWLGDRLGEIRIPVLLIAGSRDAKFTRIGRDLRNTIPDARIEIVEGAGHVPHLERPEEFECVVREFLQEVSHVGFVANGS